MAFKASNTKEFIIKAKMVHGDKYDYSQVVYVKNSIKVNIICKEHGIFSQIPQNHLRGSGCPECAKHTKYTKDVCRNEANKYTTRRDFKRNSPKIYDTACTKHWLDEICSHMVGKIKHKAGWWDNIENCIATASLYNSPQELKNVESGCHASISKHKWQNFLSIVFAENILFIQLNIIFKKCTHFGESRYIASTQNSYLTVSIGYLFLLCPKCSGFLLFLLTA